ncbi:hypothetical protein GQ457_12G008000 [Hibiscus cannabinus]
MDVAHCYLEGNADAVEFCPHDGYQNVLAASTYTLKEGEQPTRAGIISLFDVNAEKGNLELFHCVDTAGDFDIKWSPVGSSARPLLAQADADGYLRLYSLEGCSNEEKPRGDFLNEVSGERISSSNPSATSGKHMTLSFDIHQPQLMHTGSDDCKFSCWDIRDSPSEMVFQNSKITIGLRIAMSFA